MLVKNALDKTKNTFTYLTERKKKGQIYIYISFVSRKANLNVKMKNINKNKNTLYRSLKGKSEFKLAINKYEI